MDKLKAILREFVDAFSIVGASLMLFASGGYLGGAIAKFFELSDMALFFACIVGCGGGLVILMFLFIGTPDDER